MTLGSLRPSTRSRRPSLLSGASAALVVLSAAGGCSALFDLNATQCAVDADCRALGPQFAKTECQERVCVSMGGSATAGGGGDGNSGGAPKGDGGAIEPAAGTPGAGMGGEGPHEPPPECVTNADCIAIHVDQPYICRNDTCVKLTNAACPVLLPTNGALALLKGAAKPIIVGGFSNMTNTSDPGDSPSVVNWDLAFGQFNEAFAVGGNGYRPILALLCQGSAANFDVDVSMTHLTEEVGVPAILSSLLADNLSKAWDFTQTQAYSDTYPPVFFMSAGSADLRLADLADDGLIWHELGNPRSLAATAAGLLQHIEPFVNAERSAFWNDHGLTGSDDPATDLKVTLVVSDQQVSKDLKQVLTTSDVDHPERLLTFNGAGALAAANSLNFNTVSITSTSVASAISELEARPPHVVVAMAGPEIAGVIQTLEAYWGGHFADRHRPYYILSQLVTGSDTLKTAASTYAGVTPPLAQRMLGINYGEALDAHTQTLITKYFGELQDFYKGTLSLEGTENFYDAAYAVLYAVSAVAKRSSPSAALTGDLVREAFRTRVINAAGTPVDIGPVPIYDTVSGFEKSNYRIALWGTMGPPDTYDLLTGTRINVATSAWCLGSDGVYQYDGLIYDPLSFTFSKSPKGVPACLGQYQP